MVFLLSTFYSHPLRPDDKSEHTSDSYQSGDDITDDAFFWGDMQTFRRNQNITAANHRHEQCRNQRYQVAETILASLPCAGEELCSIGRPVVVRRTKRGGVVVTSKWLINSVLPGFWLVFANFGL